MELITQEIFKKAAQRPIGSTDEMEAEDIEVLFKLFTPDANGTWYITEMDLETGEMFGYCDLGMGFPELGYVMLDELKAIRGPFGLPVERDLYWEGTLKDAMTNE